MTEAKNWVMSEEFLASFFAHKFYKHALVLPEDEIQPFVAAFERIAKRYSPAHLGPNPINDPKVKILAWVWRSLDNAQKTKIVADHHADLKLSLALYEVVKTNVYVFENMSDVSIDNEHWVIRLYARTVHNVSLIDVPMPDQEKVKQLFLKTKVKP